MQTDSGSQITKLFLLFIAVGVLFAEQVNAQDSNRESVRASVSRGEWYVVWGETVNEAEYLKLTAAIAASVACECTAPVQGYFEDYYRRTVAKVQRNAPEVGQRVLEDLIAQAFNDPGRVLSYRGVEVAAGIATYNRWYTEIHHEPRAYSCGQNFLGADVPCTTMEEVRNTIPLPNWHQPYIKLRFTSSGSGRGNPPPSRYDGKGYSYDRHNKSCISGGYLLGVNRGEDNVRSFADCKSRCDSNARCNAFGYEYDNYHYCTLYSRVDGFRYVGTCRYDSYIKR